MNGTMPCTNSNKNSFSRLLEGEITDQELSALTGCGDFLIGGSDSSSGDINAASQGFRVACTAAALDGNPILEDPFFFVETPAQPPSTSTGGSSNRTIECHATGTTLQPPPPPDCNPKNPSKELPESAEPRGSAQRQEEPDNTKKRSLEGGDMGTSFTKSLLKKARRISFESSCGGQMPPVRLPPAEPLKISPQLKPKKNTMKLQTAPPPLYSSSDPNAAALPENGQPQEDRHTSFEDPTSETAAEEALKIVDTLIETLAVNPVASAAQLNRAVLLPASQEGEASPAKEQRAAAPAKANDRLLGGAINGGAGPKAPPKKAGANATNQRKANIKQSKASATSKACPKIPPPPSVVVLAPFKSQEEEKQEQQTTSTQPVGGPRKRMRYASQEEKERINRDRNRVHARNTRLRKKAYVDELKKQINDLVDQRDAANASRVRQAKIFKQNKSVRFMVVENFLKLQALEEASSHRWNTLLKEDVTMAIPAIIPTNQDSESSDAALMSKETLVKGIQPLMDSSVDLIKSLRQACNDPNLEISFQCDRKSFMMDGCTTVAQIQIKCSSSCFDGKQKDFILVGSLRTRFCVQTNKIQSGRLLVDFGTMFLKQK